MNTETALETVVLETAAVEVAAAHDADAVITVSEATRRDIAELLDLGRKVIVDFNTEGRKTLILEYARLERVG